MIRVLAFLLLLAPTAISTVCVVLDPPHAREAMSKAAVVFRGVVIEKTEVTRPDMVAQRFVTRFRVKEYWKGNPGEVLTLYDTQVFPTLDCGPSFEAGKEYLVYAVEEQSEDLMIQEAERKLLGAQNPRIRFVRGWTDVVPRGTRILTRGLGTGEVTDPDVRRCIQVLTAGRPGA